MGETAGETVLRPFREEDAEAVASLYRAAFGDDRALDAEEIISWFRNPGFRPDRMRVLAVDLGGSAPPRYVPGERVGLIFPGKVTVQFSGSEARELELFEAPKAVTVWRPSAPSLTNRLSNWMRGKR